jgi:hypothetical protein
MPEPLLREKILHALCNGVAPARFAIIFNTLLVRQAPSRDAGPVLHAPVSARVRFSQQASL